MNMLYTLFKVLKNSKRKRLNTIMNLNWNCSKNSNIFNLNISKPIQYEQLWYQSQIENYVHLEFPLYVTGHFKCCTSNGTLYTIWNNIWNLRVTLIHTDLDEPPPPAFGQQSDYVRGGTRGSHQEISVVANSTTRNRRDGVERLRMKTFKQKISSLTPIILWGG